MTEAEWLQGKEGARMFRWVMRVMSPRKFRLLVCTWCASLWDELTSPRAREVIATLERYADGLASEQELAEARTAAREEDARLDALLDGATGGWAIALRAQADALAAAAQSALCTVVVPENMWWQAMVRGAPRGQLFLCLFGNPFRPVVVDPSWLAWNDRCVPRLAGEIYEQRRYDDLPILADALEDAGCGDRSLLDHCRRATVHARGCHVLDLLLGKR